MDAFALMGTMRITGAKDEHSCEGLTWKIKVAEWLQPPATYLLEIGIALEYGHGEKIRQALKDDKPPLHLEAQRVPYGEVSLKSCMSDIKRVRRIAPTLSSNDNISPE